MINERCVCCNLCRKFSLICEEDEDCDVDDLANDVQSVKESRSDTAWVQSGGARTTADSTGNTSSAYTYTTTVSVLT